MAEIKKLNQGNIAGLVERIRRATELAQAQEANKAKPAQPATAKHYASGFDAADPGDLHARIQRGEGFEQDLDRVGRYPVQFDTDTSSSSAETSDGPFAALNVLAKLKEEVLARFGGPGVPAQDQPETRAIEPGFSIDPGTTPAVPTRAHKVLAGQTLGKIAQRYGISLNELLEANPQYKSNPNLVKKDAVLQIPIVEGSAKPTSAVKPTKAK